MNSGEVFALDWAGAGDGVLKINLISGAEDIEDRCRRVRTVAEAAAVFGDPAATRRIVTDTGAQDDATTVYDGYTHLCEVSEGGWDRGGILVTLRKG